MAATIEARVKKIVVEQLGVKEEEVKRSLELIDKLIYNEEKRRFG